MRSLRSLRSLRSSIGGLASVGVVLSTVGCGGAAPAHAPVAAAPRVTSAAAPSRAPSEPTAPTAETCDGIRECASVGLALARSRDRTGAELALGKACTGTVRSIDACAVLATLLKDEGADPAKLADAARNGCNVYGADDGERAARAGACATWAVALRDGVGTEADPERALRAFDDGCKLGDVRACESKRAIEAENARRAEAKAAAASGVPDANMTIGSITTNGTTVENIACRADGGIGGLFGSVALGKPFADKKRALDACVKGKARTTRVRWSTASGRMAEVKVISGDDPSNRCIERVLSGQRTTVSGTCAASVDLGR